MSEWYALLLEQLTHDNLAHFGAGALLWMPIGWFIIAICFCGAMLIFQFWTLPERLVKALKVTACTVMVLSEVAAWLWLVLIPCYLNIGWPFALLPALAIMVLCGLSVLLFVVWFRKVQDDEAREAQKTESEPT